MEKRSDLRFRRVVVMRHLEPRALVAAFDVEAFVCFAAVEDGL